MLRTSATLALAICCALSLTEYASGGGYPAVANRPSFVAVGDGLTESAFSNEHNGWGLLMQMKYTRKADVVNRGFGGFYTPWFVDYMLDDLFDVKNPTLAILFLGVKDSLTQAVTGSHYISPEQFGINIQKILDAAKAKGASKFLIITPPPVCEVCKNNSPKPWDRENAHTILYVQQLKQAAQKNGAAFLDIFTPWQQDPDWHNKYLLPDKLHLSDQGNSELFNLIIQTLESQVPALSPSNIALHWPLMDVIDKDNPGAAFSKVVSSQSTPSKSKGFLVGGAAAQSSGSMTAIGAGGGGSATSGSLRFSRFSNWVLAAVLLLGLWLLA